MVMLIRYSLSPVSQPPRLGKVLSSIPHGNCHAPVSVSRLGYWAVGFGPCVENRRHLSLSVANFPLLPG
jgi:hypothetical protein